MTVSPSAMHTHRLERNLAGHHSNSERGNCRCGPTRDHCHPVHLVYLRMWARRLRDWCRDMPGRHRTLRYPQSVAGKKQAAWEALRQQQTNGSTVP
jgi:hypothetical protein